MNEKIKEYKIDNIVMGILSAVVGVILVIFPGTTLRMIGYLVSAALFLMGIVSIIICRNIWLTFPILQTFQPIH